MSQIVDAHVAYCTAISDLSRDKTQLLERIKRLEEAGDRLQMLIEEQGWWESVPQEMWRKAKDAK